MNNSRAFAIAVALVVGGEVTSAQDLSRYRAYVLGSSLEAVIAASGARAADVKTLHQRPATIQVLRWRAPYANSGQPSPDSVREMSFTFYNDALYQVIVYYDRERTEGLTDSDIVESLSAAYGVGTLASGKARSSTPAEAFLDGHVVARWENAESLLTLIRASYTPEVQLILVSKSLLARAQSAVREAIRLDAVEAPRREADQRKKEAGAASAARDKARIINKAVFRP